AATWGSQIQTPLQMRSGLRRLRVGTIPQRNSGTARYRGRGDNTMSKLLLNADRMWLGSGGGRLPWRGAGSVQKLRQFGGGQVASGILGILAGVAGASGVLPRIDHGRRDGWISPSELSQARYGEARRRDPAGESARAVARLRVSQS